MKKLLLLDADVIIDLHCLGLFEKIAKSYDVSVTQEVFAEAKEYPKGNARIPIDIGKKVTIIRDVGVDSLNRVRLEAKEARLIIDPGEATSIAYLIQKEDDEIVFCTCDAAAIQLISYMDIEHRAECVETVTKSAGHHTKLLPRHLKSSFKGNIDKGKALRIQFKKLT